MVGIDDRAAVAAMAFRRPPPVAQAAVNVLPFGDAAEAWFWTMRSLVARRDGARHQAGVGMRRPCDPDDVLRALDRLYRHRRVDAAHAHVLKIWGERQTEPDPQRDRGDWRLWREAIDRLAWPLRTKGIIA